MPDVSPSRTVPGRVGPAATEFVLESPLDAHVHFRQGRQLRTYVRHTAAHFVGALAMPNTDPPIKYAIQVRNYLREIEAAAGRPFHATCAVYLTPDAGRQGLYGAREEGAVAGKLYPRGLTTNSAHGMDLNDRNLPRIFEDLQVLGMALCVHPEAPGYHEDREALFFPYAERWARKFPGLRIVLEHVSDRRTLPLLDLPNIYMTVTAHHLVMTGDDWVGPPLRPDRFCAPVCKRPDDLAAIRHMVALGADRHFDKLMFGSDSAPHTRRSKAGRECSAGVYTAPQALALLAPVFEGIPRGQARFQRFVSGNARVCYGVIPSTKYVRLRRDNTEPTPTRYGLFDPVVPLVAGATLPWRVEAVSDRPFPPGDSC